MPVIFVLDDDASTRDDLAETLRRLFPRARVVPAGTDPGPELLEREGESVILLAGLPVAERICRHGASPAMRVVALTPEMGPDTLMRAEALGVFALLRAPTTAERLQMALGPMLDGSASRSGASAEGSCSTDRE